jgi:hypothetical protein
MTWSDGSVYKG